MLIDIKRKRLSEGGGELIITQNNNMFHKDNF